MNLRVGISSRPQKKKRKKKLIHIVVLFLISSKLFPLFKPEHQLIKIGPLNYVKRIEINLYRQRQQMGTVQILDDEQKEPIESLSGRRLKATNGNRM